LAAPALLIGVGRAQEVRIAPVRKRALVKPKSEGNEARSVAAERVRPVSLTQVSFKQLADQQAKAARVVGIRKLPVTYRAVHPPLTIRDTPEGSPTTPAMSGGGMRERVAAQFDTSAPLVPSPTPTQSFLAQEDGPKLGGPFNGFFTIPPDTNGTVGLDKVFTNTNSNYRVHNKATGAPLSTVSVDSFWASTGGGNFFDPQIQYDPYNQRWILAIASNPQNTDSSIEVAVSQTSDPQGTYNVYRFIVAATINGAPSWADFPMLGFNKNWIAVGYNMFTIGGNADSDARVLVFDYSAARAGASVGGLSSTVFSDFGGICEHPVTTYSPTENNLYIVRHLSSADGTYRVETITGTATAPAILNNTVGPTLFRPGGGWLQPDGDILPQQCITGSPVATYMCPATPRGIDAGDAQVRSNPVFRNGKIYYAQTVGIDLDGIAEAQPIEHTAAQWTVIDTSGNYLDGGRVEDATATDINGGKWYAYPSLTVNKNGDVLMGFSEFESDDYADAGYTLRLAGDAAGTMRDPIIYKEGEDYYQKTFSGPRNRWGDYSHTVVDPSNDRDMWTVQEYAQQRVSASDALSTNDSRWGTYWAKVTAPAGAGELVISEFRLRGPGGANDEFIEIYNTNSTALTVNTIDGSGGYALAASDGAARFTIPNGTVIPARGHYLGVNNNVVGGYTLAGYPAGNATTATGDATYTTGIADNAGLALFNTANPASFTLANRLDAVGSTSEANTLYKEGTGYPALSGTSYTNGIEYSFFRDTCGKGGSLTTLGTCPTGGLPKDSGDNATDFVFVDTNGTSAGAGKRLGAPGPENLSSPIQRNTQFGGSNLDPAMGSSSSPNRERDFTNDPTHSSTFGTMTIRKTITNNTGSSFTRLRFRIVDVTTFPPTSGFADLRARTSAGPVFISITGPNAACPANTCTVQGTTLETPPAQAAGGGFNSTLSVGSVTLAAPIAPGDSINVQFLLGVQQTGSFKFFINVEALP
jgi:hypothetical protein